MSLRSVYCIAATRGRADSILVSLRDEGFTPSEISILFLDSDTSLQGPDPAPVARDSIGAIRGVMASLDGIQRLMIPGVGPVIASGAIARCAGGSGVGAISSMLEKFGVPGAEATRYAAQVLAGHFLIAVQTPHSSPSDRARAIFVAGEAGEICTKLDVARPKLASFRGPATRSASTIA